MPTKETKNKTAHPKRVNDVLDSFERWLSKQPVKPVRAKTGYISETEDSA